MAHKGKHGRFISSKGGHSEVDDLAEMLEAVNFGGDLETVRPIVTRIPPNFRLVLCTVGPHKLVRVMVRPNNSFYIPRMVIPMDVDLTNFDPTKLLIYNGNPPIRKGQW